MNSIIKIYMCNLTYAKARGNNFRYIYVQFNLFPLISITNEQMWPKNAFTKFGSKLLQHWGGMKTICFKVGRADMLGRNEFGANICEYSSTPIIFAVSPPVYNEGENTIIIFISLFRYFAPETW